MTTTPSGLMDAILQRWRQAGATVCLTLLSAAGAQEFSGDDLIALTSRYAGGLAARGVCPGDRVGLILPTGEAYIGTFFGTWWLGATAVPLAPPVFRQDAARETERLKRSLAVADVRLVVAEAETHALGVARTAAVALPADLTVAGSRAAPVPPAPLALIQFSSGSTGHPKGVGLTDAAIAANLTANRAFYGERADDVAVSWLPLHHDMGLIGFLLTPMVYGIPTVLMPPEAFIFDPALWLQAITHFRGTLVGAPNFAFHLCSRLPAHRLEGTDLSPLRLVIVGAEPVRPATLEAFCATLEPYGFSPKALCPMYGLAEATLAVSATPLGSGVTSERIDATAYRESGVARPLLPGDPAEALTLVSAGYPLTGITVTIRDEAGRVLPERTVGEIVVDSPGLMTGYYGDPEATAAVSSSDGLRTGDLGYMADGGLYISGRSKDVLIRGGVKYHAHDLEAVIAGHDDLRSGGIAAVAIGAGHSDREHIVILAEMKKGSVAAPALAEALRQAIHETMGLRVDAVHLLAPYQVPKTTSGKIRRDEARRRFLAGELVSADQ